MGRLSLRRVSLYVTVCLLVAVVAAWLGDLFGKQLGSIREQRAVKRQIAASLRGIKIGRPFPSDLVLWSSDGAVANYVSDLGLVNGILLFLGSESGPLCEATIDTLAQISREYREDVRAFWLVVDDDPAPVLKYVKTHGLQRPVYWDMQHTLVDDYGVPIRRTYFKFNDVGTLVDYGRFFTQYDELLDLVGR